MEQKKTPTHRGTKVYDGKKRAGNEIERSKKQSRNEARQLQYSDPTTKAVKSTSLFGKSIFKEREVKAVLVSRRNGPQSLRKEVLLEGHTAS